jgi:hypothetical protein
MPAFEHVKSRARLSPHDIPPPLTKRGQWTPLRITVGRYPDSDYERGIRSADEAIQFAAQCWPTSMGGLHYNLDELRPTIGRQKVWPFGARFLHCVLKKDPSLSDRMLATIYNAHLQLRN